MTALNLPPLPTSTGTRTTHTGASTGRRATSHTTHPAPASAPCRDCISRTRCVGARLADGAGGRSAALVRHHHTLGAREHLFREGGLPEALYVVKSGTVKLYLSTEDGSEQVIAFYMAGEVLGLDALGTNSYRSSAVTLERSTFCVIPLASLERATSCHRLLYALLSMELVRDHRTIELVTRKDAETRMAGFLVDLSQRFSARGYSSSSFNLSMKRSEIGCHLGLAVETVSRIFTRFQEEGLLRVHRRQVQILDCDRLGRIAGSPAAQTHAASSDGTAPR